MTQDIFAYKFGSVMEKYFLSSNRLAIISPHDSTLWMSVHDHVMALRSRITYSIYENFADDTTLPVLEYSIIVPKAGVQHTLRTFHMSVVNKYYGHPSNTPDVDMMTKPFWSTWAMYKKDINQASVVQFAQDIQQHGFLNNSHIEIDDAWATKYGDLNFDRTKFPSVDNVSWLVLLLK